MPVALGQPKDCGPSEQLWLEHIAEDRNNRLERMAHCPGTSRSLPRLALPQLLPAISESQPRGPS